MFERYLSDALTSHLGHIIQGFDADKVRISAWNGELVLQDMFLRKDALDHLVASGQAPVQVAYGHVGNLEVRIPWKLVRSQLLWGSSSASTGTGTRTNFAGQQQQQLQNMTCSLVLSDVNILVTPRRRKRRMPTTNENGSDDDDNEQVRRSNGGSQQTRRHDANDKPSPQDTAALDAEDAALLQKVKESSREGSKWQWILDRLVGIFSNLSVTVRNIHIRYEDPGTSMGFVWTFADDPRDARVERYRPAFAIGITLREFSVQSSDDSALGDAKTKTTATTDESNGVAKKQQLTPSSTGDDSLLPFDVRRKQVVTKQLASYWDSDCRIMAAVQKVGGDKAEESKYIDQAFLLLNDGAASSDFPHSVAFLSRHTFLLDPFSPSIQFSLVTKNPSAHSAVSNGGQSKLTPPSTMDISLPPCHFTISRYLLEDLGYLRKSLGVWTQAQQGLVSETALRRLTKLRPTKSPLEDPRSWWKYAFEAVLLLRKEGPDSRDQLQQAHGTVVPLDTFSSSGPDDNTTLMNGRERESNEMQNVGGDNVFPSSRDDEECIVTWETSLVCPEFSLQVNDRHSQFRRRPVAVVRVSCAFQQEQLLYRDGSWELTSRIGSLLVKDCTSGGTQKVASSRTVFPYLIGPRAGGDCGDDEKLHLDGVKYSQSAWVRLSRSPHRQGAGEEASTTSTEIHVLPMDFVYATSPVEALSRILITANLELSDDYHRMASRLHEWREGQKKRLLQALAHKEKRIIVDVDVGAPVLLIPEESRRDSPLLIIDFGRLKFHNRDKKETGEGISSGQHEQWRLEIADMQVQCSSTRAYRNLLSEPQRSVDTAANQNGVEVQQVVEPFSLNFDISTQIRSEEDQSVEILATLPRLVFNMSSSAVRLIRRLQSKWVERKGEIQEVASRSSRMVGDVGIYEMTSSLPLTGEPSPRRLTTQSIDRRIQFRFVAPLLNFKVENDVDGRDCGPKSDGAMSGTTLLIDLALRGIEGGVIVESSSGGESRSTFTAKLRSLDAIDLYQRAGREYSLLLSSIAPNLLSGRTDGNRGGMDTNLSATDLVTFKYRSLKEESPSDEVWGGSIGQKLESSESLSVKFHELYVEWNPETLAALQKAMKVPVQLTSKERAPDTSDDDDDETAFFDAEEDNFYDVESLSSDDDESLLISEIAESHVSYFSDAAHEWDPRLAWEAGLQNPIGLMSPMNRGYLESPHRTTTRPVVLRKPFESIFNLSKLRVNFNKESRHRALISVEMDRTSIEFASRHGGGSKTMATIGNLTFTDSDSRHNKTLYREILGLQTDKASSIDGPSSLLEMEIVMNPRSRHYVTRVDEMLDSDEVEESVSIDVAEGSIQGCDYSLRARFSPMRFVYLQQLWFEVMDYFFEGVIGSAVWGGEDAASPLPGAASVAAQADTMSFTRFDILMDSPVILFPVTYCSTDFIRLEASAIAFANRYDCRAMRRPLPPGGGGDHSAATERQWYNNCGITMTNLRLASSSGRKLSRGEDSVTVSINMDWPTGPTAPLNVPKWNVDCSFDALYVYLLKGDYALLQSIIQYNLGEESRHLDEWNALQGLPAHELKRYEENIMVPFGYDKKDVTPTTFDMAVRLPLLCFSFLQDERSELAVVRCVDISWNYKKLLDFVTRQEISCDVEVVGSLNGKRAEMLSSRRIHAHENAGPRVIPGLRYTTTTKPSGDNEKMLEITDGSIHVVYPAWKRLSRFFQGLPEPTYLSPDEVIQVGDRWYKIGGPAIDRSQSLSTGRFSWMGGPDMDATTPDSPSISSGSLPTYQFRISLKRPSIVLASESSSLLLSMDEVDFLHVGAAGMVKRTILLQNVTFQTSGPGREKRVGDLSLVQPFSISGSIEKCNGRHLCECPSHNVRLSADVFKARVAFSDMTSALDVCLLLLRDMKTVDDIGGPPTGSPSSPCHHEEAPSPPDPVPIPFAPKRSTFRFSWDGFNMAIVDDSGRHFATSQDLVILSLGMVEFDREEEKLFASELEVSPMKYSMSLRCASIKLIDSLQSQTSPFRLVLAIRAEPTPTPTESAIGIPVIEGKDVDQDFGVELRSLVDETRTYGVKVRSIALQYNPSMIIALQRFLGRLMKDAKTKAEKTFNESLDALLRPSRVGHDDTSPTLTVKEPKLLSASVQLDFVSVCLNKEHQGRRLLDTTLSDCQVNLERTRWGSVVNGHVGGVSAMDPDTHGGRADVDNRSLLEVSDGSRPFVKFRYQTFRERRIPSGVPSIEVPDWVRSEVTGDNADLDDCLDVSIGAIEFTLLRERTEELMDYLSNGMPGKGMGATSQAAKGFLKSRIQTKSFLQIHVDGPKVLIPQHENVTSGMVVRLGDLHVKSWINENIDRTKSTRMLGVDLVGFSGGMYDLNVGGELKGSPILSKVDVSIEVARTSSLVSVSCHLSDVRVHLSYTEYVATYLVLRENIGRSSDKRKWDNLEVAWEEEAASDDKSKNLESLAYSKDVSYATNARHVRYGRKKAPDTKRTKPRYDFRFRFDVLSVILRRNDPMGNGVLQSDYDMVLLRGDGFEASLTSSGDGDQSLGLSLHRFFLYDLGEKGRILRRSHDEIQIPSAFSIMVDGYSPPEKEGNHTPSGHLDAQVIISVDRHASSPGDAKVSVLINYLSIVALMHPFEEILCFLARKWPDSVLAQAPSSLDTDSLDGHVGEALDEKTDSAASSTKSFHVKFVLHYPRLILVADESDPHSRGLVLRGLAILNASKERQISVSVSDSHETNGTEETILKVSADFQNISSYINPDVGDILSLRYRHTSMLAEVPGLDQASLVYRDQDGPDEFGVALILPLTTNFEFEQARSVGYKTRRTLAVNVDPLSITASFEDVQLLKEVTRKWKSSSTIPKTTPRQTYFYDVTFHDLRLGLGLRKAGGQIVVDSVGQSVLLERKASNVETGDILYSINGQTVVNLGDVSLSTMVERLSSEPRPLTIRFARKSEGFEGVVRDDRSASITSYGIGDTDQVIYHGNIDSVDITLSTAMLTLVEKEIPLFRGRLSTTTVSGELIRTSETRLHVNSGSAIEIEYYNLRIWGWEPLVEPGGLTLSATFQDPQEGPKELAIEVGDRIGTPLCLNITDGAIEALAKLKEWNKATAEQQLDGPLFSEDAFSTRTPRGTTRDSLEIGPREASEPKHFMSRKAANAALLFARRQKSDTAKPFVFQNRTGVSIAFVRQTPRGTNGSVNLNSSFVAVGDYNGLHGYNDSEITVVGNGEEIKFRLDVVSDEVTGPEQNRSTRNHTRFPFLTVALQAVAGVTIEPLTDLPIFRASETLIPLRFSREDADELTEGASARHSVVWLVEQTDEKTTLTLGSSVQFECLSLAQVEVGAMVRGASIGPLGIARRGDPFYLPLWLAMQETACHCSVRPIGQYHFAPLLILSAEGSVEAKETVEGCIECRALNRDEASSVWLAIMLHRDRDALQVTVDCCLSIRNLLPSSIDWEIATTSSSSDSSVIDGSTVRKDHLNVASNSMLKSGEYAEVFSKGTSSLKTRFRHKDGGEWSTWASLSFPSKPTEKRGVDVDDVDAVHVRHVSVSNVFGVPLTFGVRIIRKLCGLDVVVYTELWLKNCSSLPLAFGCVRQQILSKPDERCIEGSSDEMSSAEAALKEISSLFETGEDGKGLRRQGSRANTGGNDIVLFPGQAVAFLTEECFEYIEVEASIVKRRWWASEDPLCLRENLTLVEENGRGWHWLDKSWRVDTIEKTSDEWESSAAVEEFSGKRVFSPSHRFRRRRWFRKRTGERPGSLVDGVEAFHQPVLGLKPTRRQEGKQEREEMQIAIQLDGGKFALTSKTPAQGTVYGAIRAAGARWPRGGGGIDAAATRSAYELCYSIMPLDGDWGAFTRLMLVTSRFLLRNESTRLAFEIKQTGTPDSSAIKINAGGATPFHWADFRLPELISVRPVVEIEGQSIYRWSGGFDPLTIGAVPLRIRKTQGLSSSASMHDSSAMRIRSLKMEAEIRPKTGKVGINISFQEEDEIGDRALFRIENTSTFPIWVSQDGILANPLRDNNDSGETDGDLLLPSDRMSFALDVPFRQGKYPGRKAATMSELFRLRIGLAPLSSRTGIETTKVMAFVAGERVRLNPSKLSIIDPRVRSMLQIVRVLGVVDNDGPTRVLQFRLMRKLQSGLTFSNPFGDDALNPRPLIEHVPVKTITDAAAATIELMTKFPLPTEEDAVNKALDKEDSFPQSKEAAPSTQESLNESLKIKDMIISVRASFSGFVVSLVDSCPSEIAVLALRNVNALATWNTARTTDATVYITITDVQVDNMVPNAPFPIAVTRDEVQRENADSGTSGGASDAPSVAEDASPLLVIGLSFAPRHKSGIVCLKSVTIAPHNLAIRVDLAFLVRLQKFAVDLRRHFTKTPKPLDDRWTVPNIDQRVRDLSDAGTFGVGSQKFYFGGLTILPCNIKLSVAPARALTQAQAMLEGEEVAAIHQAVRKGDVRLISNNALFGVKVGHRNSTPLAVVQGVFKSFVVDAILRLDGASLNFAGVSLRNHISTGPKLSTHLGAHYLEALRQNVPALLGSLAVFGNPLGLVRGLGDGVSDFVLEPVKGFQKSVQEMDASYLVDGVARGTVSLARHTVGGFADSTAMLTETFSKNMTVLTLDRRYAQKRDRGDILRNQGDVNVGVGFESGVQKLVQGFLEGVTGVVKAPIRGAEKRGFEGFAKGMGKGLLGLLVKPIIGISDGITDVMIGVKGSVEGGSGLQVVQLTHVRPRRALYGRERVIRPYSLADAAAAALMLRTRLAGENYLSHVDMGDRVALLSVKRLLLLGPNGEELLVLKFKHIDSLQVRSIEQQDKTPGWAIVVILNTPRRNASEIEIINCKEQGQGNELCSQLEQGMRTVGKELLPL